MIIKILIGSSWEQVANIMRPLLTTLLFCAATSALYTAEDCELPADESKENAFWSKNFIANSSFDASQVSAECYRQLVSIKHGEARKIAQNFISDNIYLFPLETKQVLIDCLNTNDDLTSYMMPREEDCDKLNFEHAPKSFIEHLSNHKVCLEKLEDASAASLAKNKFIHRALKLDDINPKHFHLFIPVLLQEDGIF